MTALCGVACPLNYGMVWTCIGPCAFPVLAVASHVKVCAESSSTRHTIVLRTQRVNPAYQDQVGSECVHARSPARILED